MSLSGACGIAFDSADSLAPARLQPYALRAERRSNLRNAARPTKMEGTTKRRGCCCHMLYSKQYKVCIDKRTHRSQEEARYDIQYDK